MGQGKQAPEAGGWATGTGESGETGDTRDTGDTGETRETGRQGHRVTGRQLTGLKVLKNFDS